MRANAQGGKVMTLKRVCYNGGTETTYNAMSDPNVLTTGQEYEVVFTRHYDDRIAYILKGISGEFDSTWFDEIHEESPFKNKSVYLGIAYEIPTVGEQYSYYKITINNGTIRLICKTTGIVKSVRHLGNSIYMIFTYGSVYFVLVD